MSLCCTCTSIFLSFCLSPRTCFSQFFTIWTSVFSLIYYAMPHGLKAIIRPMHAHSTLVTHELVCMCVFVLFLCFPETKSDSEGLEEVEAAAAVSHASSFILLPLANLIISFSPKKHETWKEEEEIASSGAHCMQYTIKNCCDTFVWSRHSFREIPCIKPRA